MSPPGPTDIRRRLLGLVKEYPGLHLREAARQLGTSVALVEYHTEALARNGLLVTTPDQRFLRLHPAEPELQVAPEDRAALHALRSRQGLLITLYLLDQEAAMAHGTICEALGMGKSTLSFHLRKLERAGIVAKTPQGYRLTDAERVATLLRSHRPTPDLRRRFQELWTSFYDEDT